MSGITITADSATQFETGAAEYNSVCRLDDTNFAVAYRDNNDGNKGKINVGSRSGITPAISEANAVTFYNNTVTNIFITAITSTKVVITFYDPNTIITYVVICTISGTTITVGTPVSLGTVGDRPTVSVLNSTNIVVTIANGYVISYVGSVSGTTVSFGSSQNAGGDGGSYYAATVPLDSTHYAIAYVWSAGINDRLRVIVGSVDTAAQTCSFGSVVNMSNFTANGGLRTPIISAFDSQHFIVGVTYTVSDNDLSLYAFEVNLNTNAVTAGTELTNSTGSTAISEYGLCAMSANNFIISYYTTTGTQAEVRSGTLSGSTTIAFDSQGPVIFDNSVSAYTALCRLTDNYFLLGYKRG